MIPFHSDAPLNPDCEEIARRRRRLRADSPLAFLFERMQEELEGRVAVTGGWGKSVLCLGFHESATEFPAHPCQRLSILEGDDWSEVTPGYDMVVMNLQLAWLDHDFWFPWVRSLLGPGGRFYFSSLGPDTLHELADAWRSVDDFPHVHPFADIHHLGDALVKAGFSRPVLDADWMGVEYEDVDLLLEDLRREGFHNVHPERRRTLTAGSRLSALRERMSAQSPLRTTFELLFGFAVVPNTEPAAIRVNPPTL